MRFSGKTWMSLSLMVIAAWAVITALKWPFTTALFPVVVGIPVFFLATSEFFSSLSKRKETVREVSSENAIPSEEKAEPLPVDRALVAFLLIIGFFLIIALLGFLIGVPLFIFLYLKIYGREKWGISVGFTAIAWACFYGLFIWLLNIPFEEGWLQEGLHALGII